MSPVPRGERLVIALIGKRNAGKSSLINAIVGQEIAIVSEVAGTTTDPVAKHYELLPLGPVTFFDTAGVDDVGDLGEKRIQSTKKILYRADIVLFVNPGTAFGTHELEMLQRIGKMEVPLLMIFNKSDIAQAPQSNIDYCAEHDISHISVSCKTMEGILQTKEALIRMAPKYLMENRVLAGDLVDRRDRVILVCPIDSAAPKGRLILPQVQVIRDLLDHDAIPVVVKETELISSLEMLKEPPRLVITDSQAIEQVDRETPENIALTTFSILFARYKGELDTLLDGIRQIDKLRDGDRVLIAEACSHHVQKDDIGRVKIPRWLNQSTGKNLTFEVFAGHDFPENLEDYALCIHCGGCMINTMEMNRRILETSRRGVPITNYGLAISKVQGVLERVVKPLGRTI